MKLSDLPSSRNVEDRTQPSLGNLLYQAMQYLPKSHYATPTSQQQPPGWGVSPSSMPYQSVRAPQPIGKTPPWQQNIPQAPPLWKQPWDFMGHEYQGPGQTTPSFANQINNMYDESLTGVPIRGDPSENYDWTGPNY